METISGGPKPTFNADEVLKATDLNQATKNWVATEVPDDSVGNVGDVVFIPGGPGGLPFGKVLQVVRATGPATDQTTVSAIYVPVTGVTVTITPISATSTLLLLTTALVEAPSGNFAQTTITDSSNVSLVGTEYASFGPGIQMSQTLVGYSAPATTSAVTYQMQFRTGSASARIYNSLQTSQIYAIEVAA